MSHKINIIRIKTVSNALAKLQTPVVFVGGATVSLYAGMAFRETVRPTDDVDVLIEIVAYKYRGKNDGRTSTDFEDIIFLLNNRNAIWLDLQNTETPVREYLQEEFTTLLNTEYFDEWIAAHLNYNEQGRVNFITSNLTTFVNDLTN